jgi:hypothetical protein
LDAAPRDVAMVKFFHTARRRWVCGSFQISWSTDFGLLDTSKLFKTFGAFKTLF